MAFISVIIPTYNREEFLKRAIDSVLNQTFKDFEVILVDDGSTDGTYNLIQQYEKITYLKQENLGVSAARNLGLEKASGEFIAFLDSDDEWQSDKLQKQVDFLQNNPSLKWVYSDETWIRSGKKVNKKNKHQKRGGDLFLASLDLCLIGASTVVIHKSFFNKYAFREDFKVCEDYDLWLKFLIDYPVGYIDEPLINKYGGHSDQLSIQYFAMNLYRIKTIHWLLNELDLSEERRAKAKEVFHYKYNILKLGALKHNNIEMLNELESLDLVS